MLRYIAIGFALLLVLVAGAAAVGYYQADARFGLSESPVVGFEEVMDPAARLVVVAQPSKALEYVKGLLPASTSAIPSWLPWNVGQLTEMGMVREAAIVVAPDESTHQLRTTIFLNEKVGGPAIVSGSVGNSFFKQSGPLVWNDPPLELPKRGLLRGNAFVAMSESVSQAVAEFWQPSATPVEMMISRNHLAEAYLDNSDGALLKLAGAMAEANGGNIQAITGDQNARDIITTIGAMRAALDITGPDEITIQLAITPSASSTEENQKKIPFVINFLAFPFIQNEAKKQELQLNWVEGKKTALVDGLITAEAKLSGFRERLQNQINAALPAN